MDIDNRRMSMTTSMNSKMKPLAGLLVAVASVALVACSAGNDEVAVAASETSQGTAAPATQTSEVPPLITTSSTEAGQAEQKVSVVALEGADISKSSLRADFNGEVDMTLQSDGDLVTIRQRRICGDECGGTQTLILREREGELPEFISFEYSTSDIYDGEEATVVTSGQLEIGEWNRDEAVSGRLLDESGQEQFVFWFGPGSLMQTSFREGDPKVQLAFLAEAEERWASAGVSSYSFTITEQHVQSDDRGTQHQVTVRNGEATATSLNGDFTNRRAWTADEIFDAVRSTIESGGRVYAYYDHQGFPTGVMLDLAAISAGEGTWFSTSEFVTLP